MLHLAHTENDMTEGKCIGYLYGVAKFNQSDACLLWLRLHRTNFTSKNATGTRLKHRPREAQRHGSQSAL